MKNIIEKIIRKRNPAFRFDPALNTWALLQFVWMQAVALLRGASLLLVFRNPRWMMCGRGVSFFNLPKISFGKFLKLGDYAYLSGLGKEGISLGNNVSIGAYSRVVVSTSFNDIGKGIRIGNNVGIGEFAYIGGAGGLRIGDDCIIGQYFSCHPENHFYGDPSQLIRHQGVSRKGIHIGQNCWLGSKVTILDGVSIGDGCVVAAGSVVTQSFPENVIIGGVPAKILKQRIS